MKPSKHLVILVAMMIFFLVATANGFYETVKQDREIPEYDDHPWGGESDRPGSIDVLKTTTFDYSRMHLFFIGNIQVIYVPTYQGPSGVSQEDSVNLLPGTMNVGNNRTFNDNQKGQ